MSWTYSSESGGKYIQNYGEENYCDHFECYEEQNNNNNNNNSSASNDSYRMFTHWMTVTTLIIVKHHRMKVKVVCCTTHTFDVYKILFGKFEGKRPLGRPRHRYEDNIKMSLKKWYVMVWTGFIWLRIGSCGGLL
jgi:hypothetical protein